MIKWIDIWDWGWGADGGKKMFEEKMVMVNWVEGREEVEVFLFYL